MVWTRFASDSGSGIALADISPRPSGLRDGAGVLGDLRGVRGIIIGAIAD